MFRKNEAAKVLVSGAHVVADGDVGKQKGNKIVIVGESH